MRLRLRQRLGSEIEPAHEEPAEIPMPAEVPAPSEPNAPTAENFSAVAGERDALAARLARLERMLSDPEAGQNAILYFRLRAIWKLCHRELAGMATQFRAKYEAQTTPGDAGALPLAKRRAINTLLIAAAQEYYLLYREEQIAEMAALSTRKPVEETHFGLAEECIRLGAKARELAARAQTEKTHTAALRRRAKYLHEHLRFEEGAALPVVESLNSMPDRIANGEQSLADFGGSAPVNVLALNFWNLGEVLLP